jgi:hypothetical protein
MKYKYLYEWQTCYVDEGHSDYFKTLKECLEQHSIFSGKRLTLKDLLDDKTIEFTLTVTNFHEDSEDGKEYAFVKNYKLDEINDRNRKVPQKYIKEFNKLI